MPAILLVHGIDDAQRRMQPLKERLQEAGYENVHAMHITPNDGSISMEEMGQQVLQEALYLRRASGAAKIDVVGYSMGAIAARYFIQRLGGAEMVRRFVSLAAPHHGTLLAWLRGGQGVRQMRYRSPFLEELNADSSSCGEVEVYSFWTPLDLSVIPATSARLDGAHNQRFLVLCHPWMTRDKRVAEAVIKVLG